MRPWIFGSAVWIAPAVFATINQAVQRRLRGEPPAGLRELLWAGGDWLIYAMLSPAIFAVSSRWPIARPHILKRMTVHFGFALLSCVAWASGGKLLQLLLTLTLKSEEGNALIAAAGDRLWQKLGADLLAWIFTTLPFGIIVYLCVAGMAHAIRYFVEARDREVQMAQLSEQLAGARFAALQGQINPHFLFNTLNTIAVLVRDGDKRAAAAIVEHLSEVLRRTLSRHRTNEVTLNEELELVRQYLAIEQARFSDRLRPEFEIDPLSLSAAVPSFALQHLVENAIRHGIAKQPDAGRVRIVARRDRRMLELSVIDDGAGFGAGAGTPGHGIENTRERLRVLYGGDASLEVGNGEAGGTIANLRVPYRKITLEAELAAR